jgi:hypothetical protein
MDKKMWESKKFAAFLVTQILLTGLMVFTIWRVPSFAWAPALFLCIGMIGLCSLALGYIVSQKALDKFIEGVEHLEKDGTP